MERTRTRSRSSHTYPDPNMRSLLSGHMSGAPPRALRGAGRLRSRKRHHEDARVACRDARHNDAGADYKGRTTTRGIFEPRLGSKLKVQKAAKSKLGCITIESFARLGRPKQTRPRPKNSQICCPRIPRVEGWIIRDGLQGVDHTVDLKGRITRGGSIFISGEL